MTKDEMYEWIDNATYIQLLDKIRFSPVGSEWFQGEVGDYFMEVYKEMLNKTSQSERVSASKILGW